jgi:hypothetical protein
MTRSVRLTAAMVAALIWGVWCAPAYAHHTGCEACGSAEGTKFEDLDADGTRDSGEPGLPGFRIWADYDNDGVLDDGEPYDDTDSSGHYEITGINPPETRTAGRSSLSTSRTYRLREKLASGSGTGEWACSAPGSATAGGFADGAGGGFRCGWGPINVKCTPKATHKDFGNYRKAKITVVKDLLPRSDAGRFDLKVDGATVKAGAGDGGSGSLLVAPGHHHVTETAVAGTDLADYAAATTCTKGTASRTYGPGWVDVGAGDQVTCTVRNVRLGTVEIEKQTDPDETDGASFGFTGFAGGFSLADDGVRTIARVTPRDEPYTVSEAASAGYRLSAIHCSDSDSTGSPSSRTASIRVAAGEKVRCTFVNTKLVPGLQVVKDGPAAVHHGDTMTFTFAVSNTGNSPLHDVRVTDDHCAMVSAAPVERRDDDGDDLLEPTEVWVFSCSMGVPAHAAHEQDPVHNVATATGDDEEDTTVSATDDHLTDIIHPAIALKKTADRETASVGDTIVYRFDVTNPGDTGLAVTFADPRCDGGTIAGPEKVAGDTDGSLEPLELWRYRCTHRVTDHDPDPLTNTARVTGVDTLGGPRGTVTDEDSATVELLQPAATPPASAPPSQIAVLGETERPLRGRAHISGASGCTSRAFRAVVGGRQIRRVTFSVDGRRTARRSARGNQRRFSARIRPSRLGIGVHRVTARVVFRTASGTRSRTLVLSFQRCARRVVTPRFTG